MSSGGTPTISAAEYRALMGQGQPSPADIAFRDRGVVKTPRPKGQSPSYKPGRMNKLETAYASRLEAMRLAGEIVSWRHESVKLRLADRTWYTPDFKVLLPNGQEEFHETKGHMRDDAAVKLKVAAEMYPEYTFRLVRRKRGAWVVEEI